MSPKFEYTVGLYHVCRGNIQEDYRELRKSSLFVLFSRNQLRNSVSQKSSLFGFPQAECRICDDVLFLIHYFANVAFRLVFA